MRSVTFSALLCLGLGAWLAGCGGSSSHTESGQQSIPDDAGYAAPPPPQPVSGRSVPDLHPASGFSALAGLGSPRELLSQLAAAHAASFTQSEGHKDGAEFSAVLPNNRVTVGGTALAFDPDFGSGSGLSDLAYGIWDFTLPSAQTGLLGTFNWGVDPALNNLYLGLGNFDQNRWDWVVPTEIVSLNLASCAPYIDDATDRFLLVVAITGSSNASLTEVQLQGVEPPVVNLDADVASGLIPLEVDFDGSTSFDPDGSIVKWEWDFDGDGNFGEAGDEADNADNPDPAPVTYSTAGAFDATLRLTDDDGASAQSFITITTNIAPTVQLNADVTTGDVPLQVTFTATPADANGSIVTIEWDFDGNGSFNDLPEEQAASGDATPPPYTYNSPGSFNAAVRVFDDQSAVASDILNIQVGSPPNVNLSALPTSGPKPLMVAFTADASDPGGSIDDIEWDFDGDGNFNESGNGELAARGNATPNKNYSSTGERDAVVRVTDNSNATATDTVHISVTNTPPNADLQSDVNEGTAPLNVSFDASGSADPGGSVADYEWDFDGDDVFNEAGAEATAQGDATPAAYQYANPGGYSAQLRVVDDDGATDVASLAITVHGWVFVPVDDPVGADVGYWGDIALINGNPAIAYRDGTNNTLKYAYSSTATGGSASDWTTITVATAGVGQPGRECSLCEVNGGPAVSYCDNGGGNMIYQRASTATGASPGDWSAPVHIQDTDDVGYNSELLMVQGQPAVVYDDSTNGELTYSRSSTGTGEADSDWSTKVDIDGAGALSASGASFAIVNGNPAVAYYYWNGTNTYGRYCRSSTTTGGAGADWSSKQFLTGALTSGAFPYSLATVNGNPAVCLFNTDVTKLQYIRATDASGGAWGSLVDVETSVDGSYDSMAVVDGYPTIVYHYQTPNDLVWSQSSNINGTAGSWAGDTVLDGSVTNVGRYCTLVIVDGDKPAIYYRSDTDQSVRYAVRY